ncbi:MULTISPECIES: transposase [Blautia]|uniref:transposase n=1 Tax=Blautia TaxID=572511 RepID=UPI001FA9458E|nr:MULTISPECIES: transposase [Blautia]
MERLIEQIADANNKRYGRSSERLDVIAGQLELELIFNEAEALTETLYVVEPAEEDVIRVSRRKKKGKREEDLKDLPVEVIPHTLGRTDGSGFQMKSTKESVFNPLRIQLKSIM